MKPCRSEINLIEKMNGPKYSFLGKPKDMRASLHPGPGHYIVKDDIVKDRVKSPDLRNGSSFVGEKPIDLGPGEYFKEEYFARKSPPITIKGRPNPMKDDEKPGPGHYEP